MGPLAGRRDSDAAMEAARRAFAGGDPASAERICKTVLAAARGYAPVWAAADRDGACYAPAPRPRSCVLIGPSHWRPTDPIAHVLRAKGAFSSPANSPRRWAPPRMHRVHVGVVTAALDSLGAIFGMLGRHAQAGRSAQPRRCGAFRRSAVPVQPRRDRAYDRKVSMRPKSIATPRLRSTAAIASPTTCAPICGPRPPRAITLPRWRRSFPKALRRWNGEVMRGSRFGKEYEDLEDHERAFPPCRSGLRPAAPRECPYDHRTGGSPRSTASSRRRTLVWRSGPRPQADLGEAEPIFVVGLPRTGTTLVERIVAWAQRRRVGRRSWHVWRSSCSVPSRKIGAAPIWRSWATAMSSVARPRGCQRACRSGRQDPPLTTFIAGSFWRRCRAPGSS